MGRMDRPFVCLQEPKLSKAFQNTYSRVSVYLTCTVMSSRGKPEVSQHNDAEVTNATAGICGKSWMLTLAVHYYDMNSLQMQKRNSTIDAS